MGYSLLLKSLVLVRFKQEYVLSIKSFQKVAQSLFVFQIPDFAPSFGLDLGPENYEIIKKIRKSASEYLISTYK
mgnify:CR=1 FL=1